MKSRSRKILWITPLAAICVLHTWYAFDLRILAPGERYDGTGCSFNFPSHTSSRNLEVTEFSFGNGEGLRVMVNAKMEVRAPQTLEWEELQVTNVSIPNRRKLNFAIRPPAEGEWKLKVAAYRDPNLLESALSRFQGHTPGGLIGAWESPLMRGAPPAP